MDQETIAKIRNNPKYRELLSRRSWFGWTLSLIVCLMYYGFILVVAFHKEWLGTPLSEGAVMTWGIPVGVFVIVSSFVLTGLYVWRANTVFDRLANEIKEDIK